MVLPVNREELPCLFQQLGQQHGTQKVTFRPLAEFF